MKLLLFDIDGTLLVSNGAGRRAMKKGLSRLLSKQSITFDGIDFGGRTDPQIIKDILIRNGLEEKEADAVLPEALDVYQNTYTNSFDHSHITALSGVVDLIESLADIENIQLALLTGNVQPTAYLKIEAIGLAHHFPFGAFGSDDADRYKLPRVALRRALDHNGQHYREKNIVIIGDTKHDILCGRDLNVYSVAVSTGHYQADDLRKYDPDVLLDDLSDTEQFIELVV